MAKYIEYQFQLPASEATVALGVVALLSVIIGTLSSAWLINRFKMDSKQCALFALGIFILTPFFFLALLNHCSEIKFIEQSNATSVKCADCNCTNFYNPVCFKGQFLNMNKNTSSTNVYQSACHAGCHQQLSNDGFTRCLCIDENLWEIISTSFFINLFVKVDIFN